MFCFVLCVTARVSVCCVCRKRGEGGEGGGLTELRAEQLPRGLLEEVLFLVAGVKRRRGVDALHFG